MEATFTARLMLKTSRFDGGWANASHFILCLYRNGMQVSNFLCFILLTVRTNHHHCRRRERIFAEKVGTVYRKTRPELQGWVGYLWRIHHLCTKWLLRKRCCFFFLISPLSFDSHFPARVHKGHVGRTKGRVQNEVHETKSLIAFRRVYNF